MLEAQRNLAETKAFYDELIEEMMYQDDRKNTTLDKVSLIYNDLEDQIEFERRSDFMNVLTPAENSFIMHDEARS